MKIDTATPLCLMPATGVELGEEFRDQYARVRAGTGAAIGWQHRSDPAACRRR